MVESLGNKIYNLYIWCDADRFLDRHQLCGFYKAMFISEIDEAIEYGFDDVGWDVIRESNDRFSSIAGKYIDEPLDILFENIITEYSLLARTNLIARFNMERLKWAIHINIFLLVYIFFLNENLLLNWDTCANFIASTNAGTVSYAAAGSVTHTIACRARNTITNANCIFRNWGTTR